MNIKYILPIGLICIALISCKEALKDDLKKAALPSGSEIDLNDKKLDSILTEYVRKYVVDPKERILSLSVYRDPVRHFYFLTQIRRKAIIENNIPDYFFVHDRRFIVLLNLGLPDYCKKGDVMNELDSIMQRLDVNLSTDRLDYNPPLWEFMKDCDGKFQIRNSEYSVGYVPCGYRVIQDSIHFGNFLLSK